MKPSGLTKAKIIFPDKVKILRKTTLREVQRKIKTANPLLEYNEIEGYWVLQSKPLSAY